MQTYSRRLALTIGGAGLATAAVPAVASADQPQLGANDRRLRALADRWFALESEHDVAEQDGILHSVVTIPADSLAGVDAKMRLCWPAQCAPHEGILRSALADVRRLAARGA